MCVIFLAIKAFEKVENKLETWSSGYTLYVYIYTSS